MSVRAQFNAADSYLTGTVVSGYGLASLFMSTDEYGEKIRELTGNSNICHGTLNLKLNRSERPSGAKYIKEDEPLLINLGRKGLWVLPIRLKDVGVCWAMWGDEPGYPDGLIEIISTHHLRSFMGWDDGDQVELQVAETRLLMETKAEMDALENA